ncbi:MAG: urea transporter [Bacteroidales bacterium]
MLKNKFEILKANLQFFINSTLNSYSLIFFSENKLFGTILLIISFMDVWAGLGGFFSVLAANLLAFHLGYSHFRIEKGYYAFNSLLTGLGIGLAFIPAYEVFAIIIIASIFAFLISIAMEGILAKYYLPFISIPFIISLWIVVLATRDLSVLGISERGIYTTNELFNLGGKRLSDIYIWINNIEIPHIIETYLLALGAIFFQYNLLAGLLIALGLFFYSRISFVLSIIGFTVAYYFYRIMGADIALYGYSYIGFNYILTAIAIGGHFLVPSKQSFIWVLLLLPIVALVGLGLSKVLIVYQLSIYSLPFNLVVLLFLFSLKLRLKPNLKLSEVLLQQYSPEKNLYFHSNARSRFKWLEFFPVSLPFYGEWTVSQAQNGEYTHIGEWANAWDFVITDKENCQYRNEGNILEDYYCYNKQVLAPAFGTVVDLVDGIEDNEVGKINIIHNWGNSIVIRHADSIFTQLSHLKPDSIKVKKGDFVRKGEIIAQCGNSGRSPYPHLHFQVQTTPFVGSKTLEYPVDHYVINKIKGFELLSYSKPLKDDRISNIAVEPLLKEALEFVPGQELSFLFWLKNKKMQNLKWEVKIDIYNNTYIYCKKSDSFAYFFTDGNLMYFKNFIGSKKSGLYYFYLSLYNVPFGFYRNMTIEDTYPIHLVYNKYLTYFQDFIAPFYLFLKAQYSLTYLYSDNTLSPTELKIESRLKSSFFGLKRNDLFQIYIDNKGISSIKSDFFILEVDHSSM